MTIFSSRLRHFFFSAADNWCFESDMTNQTFIVGKAEQYKKIWNPLVGNDSLICEPEESNEHDKYEVAIVFDDCLLKKVVGHVPLYWSKLAFKFLQFQIHSIRVVVTGMRVNRGAVIGLEIPVDYFFMETEGS